jgi:hypothetical protein
MKNYTLPWPAGTSRTKKNIIWLTALLSLLVVGMSASTGISDAACGATPDPAKGTNTMTVNIPAAGTYNVWSRVLAPDSTNNSYFLQIDGECAYNVGDNSGIAAKSWTWVDHKDATTSSIIRVNLSAGQHKVVMTGREPNVGIDRVLFLSDLNCVPSGDGGNCTTTAPPPDTTTPTVSMTAPVNNATVSGKSVAITANASDNVGVTGVQFKVDGINFGNLDTTSPYSINWDSTTVPDGTHTLSAVAHDAADNVKAVTTTVKVSNAAPIPQSSPSGGQDIVPGTGTVRAQDLGTDPNPCNIWGTLSTPANTGGCKVLPDPYVVMRSGDGDPHIPVDSAAPNSHYRRYITKAGVVSLYEIGTGNTFKTRTQTEKWSKTGNQMWFPHGTYAFYLSFRLQSPSPFPNVAAGGGGNTDYSQLFQFKSFGDGSSLHPPLTGSIGKDSLQFKSGSEEEPPKEYRIVNNVPTGRWIRMAVVVNWQSDDPWYEIWADLDNSNKLTKIVDRVHTADLTEGRQYGALGIGFYHQLDLFDGTKDGNPRQETVYTDYANVQMTNWTDPETTPPPAGDTTAPTASFTSPANGATVSGTVTAAVNASDNNRIDKVEISLDGSLKMTDTSSPYNYSFDSKALTNGSHTLTAKAYDASGNTKTTTITVNVNNPDTTAPAAPTSLSASASSTTSVKLSWNAAKDTGTNSTGVTKYNVLRKGPSDSSFVVIAQPTTTSYTDTNRTANTTYSYIVQAVDGAGNVSSNSNTATVITPEPPSTPDTTPPTVPGGVKTTVISSDQVNISWNSSSDTGGSGLAGYNIYRDGTKLNAELLTATTYGDSTVNPKNTYSYKIEAVDGAGNKSARSAEASATTPAAVRGDVTGPNIVPDGKIDLRDISYLIRNYNHSSPSVDVTGPDGQPDGKIDIYDLSYVIRNYDK